MDLELKWEKSKGDIDYLNNDLVEGNELKAALLVSLFTDRRAEEEELPPSEISKRGWWGDKALGSKLWTLERELITVSLLERMKNICEEALLWLNEEDVTTSIEVNVTRIGTYSVAIEIKLTRGSNINWFEAWEGVTAKEFKFKYDTQ